MLRWFLSHHLNELFEIDLTTLITIHDSNDLIDEVSFGMISTVLNDCLELIIISYFIEHYYFTLLRSRGVSIPLESISMKSKIYLNTRMSLSVHSATKNSLGSKGLLRLRTVSYWMGGALLTE
jgi:hypothetical protein